MFISEKNKRQLLRIIVAYIGITAFIALFGFIYEQFSHGANSPYMWFAWVWVLGFGLLPHLILYFAPVKYVPGLLSGCLYNLGAALISTRSIFIGVVTIANTPDPRWPVVYLIVSLIFLIAGASLYLGGLIFIKDKSELGESK